MRNITPITKYLLLANIAVYLITLLFGGLVASDYYNNMLIDIFGLHFFLADDFHVYQLLTYMFMHGGFAHLFFNMFALWMFGCVMERVLGPKRYLTLYFLCGIGAGLFQELAQFVQFYMMASEQIDGFSMGKVMEVAHNSQKVLNLWTTVGASGAIYGLLLAFGMRFPEEKIFIFPIPIPIKAKWFIGFYVVIELLSVVSNDGVAHLAHLGGMVIAFFLMRYWKKHPVPTYSKNEDFFENLRSQWTRRKNEHIRKTSSWAKVNSVNPDWGYNEQKRKEQDEIDAILDKIRKSGYDSLTAQEKRTLFEQSSRK